MLEQILKIIKEPLIINPPLGCILKHAINTEPPWGRNIPLPYMLLELLRGRSENADKCVPWGLRGIESVNILYATTTGKPEYVKAS